MNGQRSEIIVMGLDPGLAALGYGVIATDTIQSRLIEYGALTTPADEPLAQRLRAIYVAISALVEKHKPEFAAVETLYFAKNTRTAIVVAQARGAALAALAGGRAEVRDITPLQIKQALTGYGRAEKHQIQAMVKTILCLSEIPRPDHAADALAAAIACAHTLRRRR
ncbi:MAG: crossover junction endodeoxyribonuclease RuvC [Candidatus Sumerlaeota bacterium]|nr:crossover junction endodeoxyribonuclease RuvC [Candidatus Sumerlaeota bacterium]